MRLSIVCALVMFTLLPGCNEDKSPPRVEIVGGKSLSSHHQNIILYGFAVDLSGHIPKRTFMEAELADLAGGAPMIKRQPVRRFVRHYRFESPLVFGESPLFFEVLKGRSYRVTVRLIEWDTGQTLASASRDFRLAGDW